MPFKILDANTIRPNNYEAVNNYVYPETNPSLHFYISCNSFLKTKDTKIKSQRECIKKTMKLSEKDMRGCNCLTTARQLQGKLLAKH